MFLKVNGKEVKIRLKSRPREGCSKLHTLARQIIKQVYPYDVLLEEIFIPTAKIYLDFYIPMRHICIEVQGEQHSVHKLFFHKNRLEFLKAQKRDRLKKDILEENGIALIELNHNEKEQWKNLIQQTLN